MAWTDLSPHVLIVGLKDVDRLDENSLIKTIAVSSNEFSNNHHRSLCLLDSLDSELLRLCVFNATHRRLRFSTY